MLRTEDMQIGPGEAELAIFKNEKIVNGLPTVLSFQHEDVSTY